MQPYWAVAKTAGQREAFAAEQLQARGFEIFLPKIETRKTVQPLFASYVFLLVVNGHWLAANTCFGVVSLIRTGDCPSRVPDAEIEALKARLNDRGLIALPPPPPKRVILPGARVRVTAGPFRGLNGIFHGMSTRDRVHGAHERPERHQAGGNPRRVNRASLREGRSRSPFSLAAFS